MDDELMEQLSYRLYDLQQRESSILNALQTQLAETERTIDNMLDAIQKELSLTVQRNDLRTWKNGRKHCGLR